MVTSGSQSNHPAKPHLGGTSPAAVTEVAGAGDARETLAQLRTALRRAVSGGLDSTPPCDNGSELSIAEVDAMLDSVSSSVEQIQVESAGMADELLCLYEQIGVIFDVTRRLPDVHREDDILDLFIRSLRRSFDQRYVTLARRPVGATGQPLEGGGWRLKDADIPLTDWLATVLEKCANRARVSVEAPPTGALPPSLQEIMLGPITSGSQVVGILILARTAEAVAFRSGEMLLLESLTTFCGDVIRNHRLMAELRQMSVAMVRSLVNAVDQKDEYTSGHSVRVAFYATMLGKCVHLPPEELRMLQWSALLHDVGKIGIRDDVLKKPGKLTDEEFAHIKEHPVRSHRVVEGIPQLAAALDGILYHHERYDGRGYPSGLAGENIPIQARIIQVADVFDALTSSRSYRPAYSWPEALEIMRKDAGTAIDPKLQPIFDAAIRDELSSHKAGAMGTAFKDDPWDALTRRAMDFSQVGPDTTGVAAESQDSLSPVWSGGQGKPRTSVRADTPVIRSVRGDRKKGSTTREGRR